MTSGRDCAVLICVNAAITPVDQSFPRQGPSGGQTMNRLLTLALLVATLGLTGCAETGSYPVGGAQCGPTDPVQQLDAADCVVPGS